MNSILKIFDPITKTWKGVSAIKGETGKSSYQLATEAGYAGTEAQFKTEQANVANNSARLTNVEESKAALGHDGYILPEQIDPLKGRQTGAQVGLGGHYNKPFPSNITQHLSTSSLSFEFFIEYDGSQHTTVNAQRLCAITDNYGSDIVSSRCYSNGYITLGMSNRKADGTRENITAPVLKLTGNNHVVLTIDRTNKLFVCYLNGVYFWSAPFVNYASNIGYSTIILGDPNAASKSFITRHSRIFNKALTQQEMLALWNGGHPEEYRLIDKSSLLAEYLPEYLSTTKWIDSSGNGNDLAAIGNVLLSYGRTYSGSPMTPLFTACGAVRNSSTGFYELNGLTDITEGEMIVIYNQTNNRLDNFDLTEAMLNSTARTNIIYKPSKGRYMGVLPSSQATFAQCSRMEVVKLATDNNLFSTANAINMFRNSSKLRRIIGVLLVGVNDNMFLGCSSLEDVKLQGLNRPISLADCVKLTRESIVYLITNSSSTTPITVTLHAEAKARLTAEDIALASTKNITIA